MSASHLALAKFTRVSVAMLTMCSTITATRMLMQPKFRKMTETLSAVAGLRYMVWILVALIVVYSGQVIECLASAEGTNLPLWVVRRLGMSMTSKGALLFQRSCQRLYAEGAL